MTPRLSHKMFGDKLDIVNEISEYILSTKISANQNNTDENAKCVQYNHDKTSKTTTLNFP